MRGTVPWESSPNARVAYMTSVKNPELQTFDRLLNSDEDAKINSAMFADGIMFSDTSYFLTEAVAGMQIKVNSGHCMINGRKAYTIADEYHTLPIPTADITYLVVIRLDMTYESSGFVTAFIPGNSEFHLRRNSNIWELGVARITLKAGQSVISNSNIDTSIRLNPLMCGITDWINKFDTNNWYLQFQSIVNDMRSAMARQEADFQREQQARRDAYSEWFGQVNLDYQTVMTINFDNWPLFTDCTINTVINGSGFVEEIRFTSTDRLVGQRKTDFLSDGKIRTIEVFYNPSMTVLRSKMSIWEATGNGFIEVVTTV